MPPALLKRRFAPKKRRFAPALLGPKGGPFRPKIKKNMKNEKISKTIREKRFWGNSNRKWIRMSRGTFLDHHFFFEKKYFLRGSRPLRYDDLPYLNWSQKSPDDSGKKYFLTFFRPPKVGQKVVKKLWKSHGKVMEKFINMYKKVI